MQNEPVLLLHGLASSFEHNWRQTGWVDLLADGGREVIGVDLLGHGTAAKPHDPAAYVDPHTEVVAHLPAGEPVAAIGFSLGAQMLLQLALDDPSRFTRLVLVGVGANLFRHDDHEALALAFERHGAGDDDVVARLFVQAAESAGNDLLALAAFLRRPRRAFVAADLAAVTCPVLVVMGDRDFAGPPDPLVDALPDARAVLLPGVDHFQATRDFRCIDAALDFLGVRL